MASTRSCPLCVRGMLAPGFSVLPSVPQEGNDKDSAPQLPVPLCWELALGAHRAGSCVVKRLLNKNIQSESMARLNLAPDSAAELSSGWQAASPQRSQFSFCLFMGQTEPGQPGFPPLTVLWFRTVSDFICAVLLER